MVKAYGIDLIPIIHILTNGLVFTLDIYSYFAHNMVKIEKPMIEFKLNKQQIHSEKVGK